MVTCLSLTDTVAWRESLSRFGGDADIYFRPEYLASFEANGDGEPRCLVIQNGDSVMMPPFLRCPISGDKECYDAQSPYGYGGPLVRNATPEFITEAMKVVESGLREVGCIASFLRLHPLLMNGQWLSAASSWDVRFNRPTVSIDLRGGLAEAFAGSRGANHRNMVSRALKEGFHVSFEKTTTENLREFQKLYWENMRRLDADPYYLFSEKHFVTLAALMGDSMSLAVVRDPSGAVNAAAMILWGPKLAHYHLSAKTENARNHEMNLLLQKAAEEAHRRHLTHLHLGGGASTHSDDSLFRFKERIGNSRHEFLTAGIVLDEERYSKLVASWREHHGGQSPLWFLGYRQDDEVSHAG